MTTEAPEKAQPQVSSGKGRGTPPPITHLADMFAVIFGTILKNEVKALCGTVVNNASVKRIEGSQLCVVCAELFRETTGREFER